MSGNGRAFARALVEEIRIKHGYIRQEVLDHMPEEYRREIEHAILKKDQMIASYVTTLARNLYTSNARFVFELLQNAEDSLYTKARARSEVRQVSFSLYRDRLVVEHNEDGFISENLTAICNAGKSSKTGARGYIGEKGIGFKSVFMAAYRAHIQSGDFSFYFQHRNGDSGMGMITPVWVNDDDEDLGDRLTRMTLLLHQDGTPAEIERRYQTIRKQFEEVHATILLFMKNIQQINIAFHDDDDGAGTHIIRYSVERETNAIVKATKSTFQDGEEHAEERYYHKTEHEVTGLAKHDNRTYSEQEEATGAYSKGEVVLAFPLDDDHAPVLENQHIFAFLPVREMAFKFLIQADFVTQANRQDIVTTSARNEGLAHGIADAFIKGVLQLCEHETLQYQWMRYLPSESDYPWDSFWMRVLRKIDHLVCSTPVLRPAQSGRSLRLIEDSRSHNSMELDALGSPLFPDIEPGLYLSPNYRADDLLFLHPYGLSHMFMHEIIVRARRDLESPNSRMKKSESPETAGIKKWQPRAARLLQQPFKSGRTPWQARIKELDLLPLRDGSWTSAKSGTVYYPTVDVTDLEIPSGLNLKVLDPAAVADADRKQLFDYVGVQTASVTLIQDRIKQYAKEAKAMDPCEAACHLRFLYLTEHLTKNLHGYSSISFVAQNGALYHPEARGVDIYIPDDDEFSAANLLAPTDPGPDVGHGAPGFEALFVHDAYFKEIPPQPTNDALPWKEWLMKHWDLLRYPRLDHYDNDGLSVACRYVAMFRPEKFVGLLQAVSEHDAAKWEELEGNEKLLHALNLTEVPCKFEGIGRELGVIYLPVKPLEELCGRFMLEDEFFPWLRLEGNPTFYTFPREWEALGKRFGLGYNVSPVKFALDVLSWVSYDNSYAKDLKNPARIYELYIHLQAKVRESRDPSDCQKEILSQFTQEHSIFIPGGGTDSATWALPEECVWEAPIQLRAKHSLVPLYSATFGHKFATDRSTLANFFSSTLKIRNCTWEDIVDDIRAFRNRKETDFDRIAALYTCLADMNLLGVDAGRLKAVFEAEQLTFGFASDGSTFWHPISTCLWSSATQIRGVLTLNELYPELETFFISRLGVQNLTAKMVYENLAAQGGLCMSVQEAKQSLVAFNSFLRGTEGHELDPNPVLNNDVFPVEFPDGNVQLRKGTDGFAIVDRKALGQDFAGKAKFLQLSMEEVRNFQPFIAWAGLEHRYLSKSVREISTADPHSTRPISSSSRDIKRKAHALLRIAATYDTQRIKGDLAAFYALLKSSETLETDKMTAILQLDQDGKPLHVEKATATLHIADSAEGLKIYVPRDERSQEICFNSKLPLRFSEWLMTAPTTGIRDPVPSEVISIVQSVLSVKNYALSDILDAHGIPSVDIVDDLADSGVDGENDVATPVTPTLPHSPPNRFYRDTASPSQGSSESSSDGPGQDTPSPLSVLSSSDTSPGSASGGPFFTLVRSQHATSSTRSAVYQPPAPELLGDQYSALLEIVVTAARQTTFLSRGSFDMSAIHAALDSTSDSYEEAQPYRLLSTNQVERDKSIGAAGELFVS
ncbi:hypothetical protein B0T22DRAFT_385008 [Podospora appendiculata]|uniref:Uncharacterized protein n=1 Tax=Podospora appendiculata TaxID=314037 RepID=A0AAE1C9H7_9PEZI|nr:hypothetical protein B0T22DRAFT_385008 [Podospora appendiculata]